MFNWKGFICGVVTSATFGLIPLFTLPLLSGGMNVPSILVYRFLIATVLMGAFMAATGRSFKVSRKEFFILAGLSLLYIGSAVFLFWSYHYLASGIATTMMFLYPVFVALIMITVFKERNSVWTMLAILLAVCGVSLLSWNGKGGGVSWTGILLAVLSGFSYGIYIISVNKSCVKDMSSTKLTFYVFIFTAFFLLLGTGLLGKLQGVATPKDWMNLLLLAIIPTVVSNITLVAAIKAIGSTFASVLGAMEPVTAMTVGVLVFGEPFTHTTALGVVMIIFAVTLVILSPALEKGYRTGKFLYITKVKGIHPNIVPYH
ncbi:DMT family transporter [Candidatus Avelusimicrobium stercoris]|uniref:DMT family transporter n=1 Tax=Candidatus Avelusimicrobium stercoris TaxID=1947924 RepID=UPI003D107450